MRPLIATVLKSGGDYGAKHLDWFKRQLDVHAPGCDVMVLTDDDEVLSRGGGWAIPLKYGWPGWWSKMELFRPDLGDRPLLYSDLDVVLVKSIAPFLNVKRTTLLRGFFLKDGINSSLMYLRAEERAKVWKRWIKAPEICMDYCGKYGDQKIIGDLIGGDSDRWQDVLPGSVQSYKVDVKDTETHRPSEDAVAVVFHGHPRPWNTKFGWVPRMEVEA